MASKAILALGFFLVIIGTGFVLSSGVDFSKLRPLDMTLKHGDFELSATNIYLLTLRQKYSVEVFC